VPDLLSAVRRLLAGAPLLLLLLTPRMAAEEPALPVIPGWAQAAAPVAYTPSNLWDFIDGAAESYLAYGFVDLVVGEYLRPDSLAVRAELYRHAGAANAFGIYASERAPDYGIVRAGAEGYEEPGVLNFLKGEYYVKLSADAVKPGAAEALRTVAAGIDAQLPGDGGMPAGVRRLPEAGKQPRTDGYVAENYLGYPFLRSSFTARYGSGGGFQLFVMEYREEGDAADALQKYLAAAPGKGIGRDVYRVADRDNGTVAIMRRGALLMGTVGAPDANTERRYLELLAGTAK